MNYDHRIIEAFKSNGITRVLLIDDAYDPPDLSEEITAKLVDFLESDAGKNTWSENGITEDILDTAISAASESNYDSEDLYNVYDILYTNFAQGLEEQSDLKDIFNVLKGAALNSLNPLHNLLHKCVNGGEVRTAGLKDGVECYKEFRPDILFVDYYLSDDVPPTGEVKQHRKTNARKASIDLLNQIIADTSEEDIPAIILMSSYEVKNLKKYRHDTESDNIMSLRFQFLKKEHVHQKGYDFQVDQAAADALLDTSQGYLFGKILQQALAQWKKGAQSALSDFKREVNNLDIKDIAYLLRFKLWEEEQPLSEYLQWFFGECLTGFIDEKVEWKHGSFSKMDNEDGLAESVEGAFEGSTKRAAEFFHRVKVDCHRRSTRHGYRMGDIYAKSGGNTVRAIITPDCDLIKRNGEANVKNILTIGGALIPFGRNDSAADDFILYDNKAFSVLWKPKDLELFSITGDDELHIRKDVDFLGTLRPLYAQEIQRRVINDLSRIGLPTAPALGINFTFRVWIHKKDDFCEIKQHSHATLIPARRGQGSNHLVLFMRSFVNGLMEQLSEIQEDEMNIKDVKWLNEARSKSGMEEIYNRFLIKGVKTGEEGPVGIGIKLSKKANRAEDAPWLQINLKVSDKVMEDLQFIDPLYDHPDEHTD